MTTSTMIAKARAAKADVYLDGYIRTTAYGVTTRREWIIRALKQGDYIGVAQVRDTARENAITKQIDYMRKQWLPLGNEHHPETIKFNNLKKELADGPRIAEYRLYHDDNSWSILRKTDYDFAVSLGARDEPLAQ